MEAEHSTNKAINFLKRVYSDDAQMLAAILSAEDVGDKIAIINYLSFIEDNIKKMKEQLSYKCEYRLFDIVRPTDKWIEEKISEWISCMKVHNIEVGEYEMKNLEDARDKFKKSVAYIDKIYHGQYSVEWIVDFEINYFVFKNAWWYNGDFIVLGNAAHICKDLV